MNIEEQLKAIQKSIEDLKMIFCKEPTRHYFRKMDTLE